MEKISVIIPVYNVEAYLPDCMDSLLCQTHPSIELIVVNDGSTDDSPAICDAYAKRDDRVRVIHQKNAGVSAARNAGLAAATGDWIGFVDSDDWVDPAFFSALIQQAIQTRADAVFVGYYEYLPQKESLPLVHSPAKQGVDDQQAALFWTMTRQGYFTSVWNKLFSRRVLLQNGTILSFSTSLAVGEDEVWLLTVLTRCKKIAFCPSPLYHWRSRSGSATRALSVTPNAMSILSAKQQAIALVSPYGKILSALAKSRLYNDCFHLKVIAYRTHNVTALHQVRQALHPVFVPWLFSQDVLFLRKMKVLVIGLLIRFHGSTKLVDRLFDIKRVQKAAKGEKGV